MLNDANIAIVQTIIEINIFSILIILSRFILLFYYQVKRKIIILMIYQISYFCTEFNYSINDITIAQKIY